MENYRIDSPINDVTVQDNQLAVLGSVSVEEM